jgi:triphosphoribosyl-dephospho-CoA synthase
VRPKEVARAVELACILEVTAPKPGNVNRQHDFDDTTYEDFILSAWASAPVFSRSEELSVGQLILEGVRAAQHMVSCNTNLGILLLLAPLAKAALISSGALSLRNRLSLVLDELTVADAKEVYLAIREAKAGGLGEVSHQDVSGEPTVSLRAVMELARHRDSIAAEYCSGYTYTFTIGVPALQKALRTYNHWSIAVVKAYLVLLAAVPDTLIARKAGWQRAKEVSQQVQRVLTVGALDTQAGQQELAALDNYLRSEGNRLNPGTTADLITASIFVLLLLEGYGPFFGQKKGC